GPALLPCRLACPRRGGLAQQLVQAPLGVALVEGATADLAVRVVAERQLDQLVGPAVPGQVEHERVLATAAAVVATAGELRTAGPGRLQGRVGGDRGGKRWW